MSLLLDALKKAADDKKKVAQSGLAADVVKESPEPVVLADDITKQEALSEEGLSIETEGLTLDLIDTVINESDDTATDTKITQSSKTGNTASESDEPTFEQIETSEDAKTTRYTVSDEALQMLIDKTNREVKQGNRLALFSVLIISLTILVSGGIYYYTDMLAEITILERKHQIAKQAMRSKTNKEIPPEKSEIIRNLVSESELDEKVQYAKKHMADRHNSQQVKPRPAASAKNNSTTASSVTFQKTNKSDPIAEKLDQAWLAYEAAQYDRAKKMYTEVLRIEENNRDALLGLGAIAVVEKNTVVAKNTYLLLLQQDPRDPIANAALASLKNSEVTTEADEKYLLNMLQKNPGDAHLNFALGNVYAQQEKWKQAQKSYFNALQRDNDNVDYMFNVAVSMDQLGKPKQAVVFYQDCLNNSASKQVSFSREDVRKRINELSGLD